MLEIDIRKIPVFWINLDADVVRREAMLKFFETHNFENVTRVPGVVHSEHKTGCGLAHLAAFNAAPAENFIIMEDDCVKSSCFSPVVHMPSNTDGFYLGISRAGAAYCPTLVDARLTAGEYRTGSNGVRSAHGLGLVQAVPVSSNVCKITNMVSAHAIYYRSSRYARVCANLTEKSLQQDIAHDVLFALNMQNCNVYCTWSPMFYQHSGVEATNIEICNVTGKIIHVSSND